MNRRDFIAGLTATAAGLLIPDRRIWALDRTMIVPQVDQHRFYTNGAPQFATYEGYLYIMADKTLSRSDGECVEVLYTCSDGEYMAGPLVITGSGIGFQTTKSFIR